MELWQTTLLTCQKLLSTQAACFSAIVKEEQFLSMLKNSSTRSALQRGVLDKLIWHEEIPKLYAEKHGLSLSKAKTEVYAQYYAALDVERVGGKWTDISYWFRRFQLNDWRKLVMDMKKHVFVYPDTIETLEYLSKKYRLIVVSNANKKFLNLKLEAEGLKKYFEYCFSAPNDFRISRKNRAMFEGILSKLKIKPACMVHIGDDAHLDYEVPRSAGIKSYLLSRKAKKKSDGAIFSLLELKKKL